MELLAFVVFAAKESDTWSRMGGDPIPRGLDDAAPGKHPVRPFGPMAIQSMLANVANSSVNDPRSKGIDQAPSP